MKEQKLICLRIVSEDDAAAQGFERVGTSIHYSLNSYVSGGMTIEEINDYYQFSHQITFKKYYEPKRHD